MRFSSYFSKQKAFTKIQKSLQAPGKRLLDFVSRKGPASRKINEIKLAPIKITSKKEAIFVWLKSNLRTAALLLIGGIAIFANFDQSAADFQVTTAPPLTESIAVSTPDLEKMLYSIDPYTRAIDEKPGEVAGEVVSKVSLAMAGDDFLLKPHILGEQTEALSQMQSAGFVYHIVKEGENLESIGKLYNISQETIKLANNISDPNLIKVGMRLLIPPANGIIHTVARGENVSDIVKKYQGNFTMTIKINKLGQDRKIFAGQRLVIAGGKMPAPAPKPPVKLASKTSSAPSIRRGTCANRFPFGWCTWYVASRRCVPWSGNAGAWPRNAQAQGYRVGRTPVVGAILVTHESWWGHVAYVEAVNGNTITISEMNFVRWGKVNRRTLPANYGVYIY